MNSTTSSAFVNEIMQSGGAICQPVWVYVIFAFIMALVALGLAFVYGNTAYGIVNFLAHLITLIICAIIIWLICSYVNNTLAWIIVIIIVLLQLLALAGYLINA